MKKLKITDLQVGDNWINTTNNTVYIVKIIYRTKSKVSTLLLTSDKWEGKSYPYDTNFVLDNINKNIYTNYKKGEPIYELW